MPPLLLDDEEAIAIAVGLRTAARASVTGIEETAVRALVKLEQVLPAHLRRRVSALGSATLTLAGCGPDGRPAASDGDRRRLPRLECLRFAYRSRDGTDSRREVEPHSLVNHGRRWYLVAWDRRREDWRTFRIDRLTRPAATGVRFTPRELPAKTRRRTSSRASPARPTASRRGSPCTPPPRRSRGASRHTGGRSSRSTRTAASTGRATTTSGGSRCGSRCSASTSRCTSRPSWSSTYGPFRYA